MIQKKNRCLHCGNPLRVAGASFCSEKCELGYERAAKNSCLACGTELFTGSRKDKKFCDTDCRTTFHNRQKEFDAKEIKKVDTALKQNRKILQQLLADHFEVVVEKRVLENAGFDFTYSTHQVISKVKGNTFIFCYNYGYRPLENTQIKIVKAFKEK